MFRTFTRRRMRARTGTQFNFRPALQTLEDRTVPAAGPTFSQVAGGIIQQARPDKVAAAGFQAAQSLNFGKDPLTRSLLDLVEIGVAYDVVLPALTVINTATVELGATGSPAVLPAAVVALEADAFAAGFATGVINDLYKNGPAAVGEIGKAGGQLLQKLQQGVNSLASLVNRCQAAVNNMFAALQASLAKHHSINQDPDNDGDVDVDANGNVIDDS